MKVFKLRLENSLPRMLWKTSKHGKLVRNWFPCNPVTRPMNITEDVLQKGRCPRPIVVQSFSCVRHFGTPWTTAHQASLSFTNSQSLLKLMSIKSVMPSNDLILSRPFFLLPLILPSIRVFFQWAGSSHQVAKVLELQLQHQSFQWIFRTDFL